LRYKITGEYNMPNISEYTDYRTFIQDYFNEMKCRNPHFSYELFARKIGFKSRGFLYNVISGKRNLTKSNIIKFIQTMKLNKDEANYFEVLVALNNTKDSNERNYFYEKLLSIKSTGKNAWNPQIVRKEQYEFYSQLYHSAIRTLIDIYSFKDDYDWLADNVYPKITPQQAKKSVQLLERLGFIEKGEDEKYRVTNNSIATPKEVSSIAISNYHREAGKLALNSITEIPKEKRNISSVTVGISETMYQKICEEIYSFRKKISLMVEQDQNENMVYQLNFQFYPLSNIENRKADHE